MALNFAKAGLIGAALMGTALTSTFAQASSLPECNQIARNLGVHTYPASNVAFQNTETTGCRFSMGPNGPIAAQAYDLRNPADARAFTGQIDRAERYERVAFDRAVREQRNEQRRAVRDINRGINDVNGTVRGADRLLRSIERFGHR